jgi:hypothetical protein
VSRATLLIVGVLLSGCMALPGRAGDSKQDRPQDAEKDRLALLERLGDGPIYLVETLHRDVGGDRLYLCQTVLSAKRPRDLHGMPGLGLDDKGRPIPPPDPTRVRAKQAVMALVKVKDGSPPPPPWYPLAQTTREQGAWLDPQFPGRIQCHVSDVATGLTLPDQPGPPALLFFHGRLFRVELLTRQQVAAHQPLRDDPDYYRQRTAALKRELLTAHRDWLTQDQRHLAGAAVLLGEPFLWESLHQGCRQWIERAGSDKAGFPRESASALGWRGEPEDLKLLQEWVQRRPEDVHPWLTETALNLTQRKGARTALPLLADLLHDPAPAEPEGDAKRLLDFDRALPAPTRGDRFLLCLLELARRSPADFGLANVPARLLAERLTVSPEDRERIEAAAKHPMPGDWLFPSEAARRQGIEQAIAWLKTDPGGLRGP